MGIPTENRRMQVRHVRVHSRPGPRGKCVQRDCRIDTCQSWAWWSLSDVETGKSSEQSLAATQDRLDCHGTCCSNQIVFAVKSCVYFATSGCRTKTSIQGSAANGSTGNWLPLGEVPIDLFRQQITLVWSTTCLILMPCDTKKAVFKMR